MLSKRSSAVAPAVPGAIGPPRDGLHGQTSFSRRDLTQFGPPRGIRGTVQPLHWLVLATSLILFHGKKGLF